MDKQDALNKTGNPEKVYREEMQDDGGNIFSDTPTESAARDAAKIEKAATGQSQKMDGSDTEEFADEEQDNEIKRETLENK